MEENLLGFRGKEGWGTGGLGAGVVLNSSAPRPTSSWPVPPAIRSGLKAGVHSLHFSNLDWPPTPVTTLTAPITPHYL